jgi:hypothetical protein
VCAYASFSPAGAAPLVSADMMASESVSQACSRPIDSHLTRPKLLCIAPRHISLGALQLLVMRIAQLFQ